jgi:quercetin dioxygenase-like cupin family protein
MDAGLAGGERTLPGETARMMHNPAMKATSLLQVKNDRVIVTEWRFAPGADTGDHVHAHDYVVVPLTSGTLRLEEPTGSREARLEVGGSYARPAGVAHNVVNINPYEFRFVEIELL